MYTIKDNEKTLYVTCTPDVDPNDGGLYCEVYDDENLGEAIDNFCIHKEWLDEATEKELIKNEVVSNFQMHPDAEIIDEVEQ